MIMLTGDGDERLAAEAMRLGAYDYFPKRSINSVVLARSIHQALEKFDLDQQLENTESVIFTMAAAVEAKDATTGEHLQRMTHYAGLLGLAMGLSEHEMRLLRYGAILHDIGKVGVSEAILCKPGLWTSMSGRRCGSTRWLARRSAPSCVSPGMWDRSFAITTSAGTARATRTRSPARGFPCWPG